MKARTVGPVLLIMLGVAALFAPSSGALPVGDVSPCRPTDLGVVSPCPSFITEVTTTTTAPATTTTEPVTETTMPETTIPATTEPVTVTTPPTTMVSGTSVTPTTVAHVAGELARTGSNTLPSTLVGIAMIALGFVLLALGRRRARAA